LCTAFNAAGGFTLETWVNFASFANSNLNASSTAYPYMITNGNANASGSNWAFGATVTGNVAFNWWGGTNYGVITANTMTTGQWTHLLVTASTTTVSIAINGVFSALTGQGYTPTSGNNGTTPTIAPSTVSAPYTGYGISLGQWNNTQGPNYAIAKARLVYGAQLYSAATFTPSPNFITSATAPVWSLDSQYPLPTYPSIQDVTPLPSQLTSYGSIPTPVGGVTSNTIGPYTSSPQLDSIRFDGTGYIDYGNAASSALTTNIWANAWTIEGWVYPTALGGNTPIYSRSSYGTTNSYDLLIYTQGSGLFVYAGNYVSAPSTLSLNTWQHIAVTYDGSVSNIYVGGSYKNGGSVAPYSFNPTYGTLVGAWGPGVATGFGATTSFQGNLADLRVSNVARYTGSSYTVPSAPFATDSSTLLLLKSLGGQVGTTLEIQGRGLNSTSIGAGRTVQSYPPAPMSSYLLDTTSNASVTYGQGKYVASASTEFSTAYAAYLAFDKSTATAFGSVSAYTNGVYGGSVTTVDALGNSYAGEWLQIQVPVSTILSSFTLVGALNGQTKNVKGFTILGSRDGINWTQVYTNANSGFSTSPAQSLSFTVSATQAYTYYRMVAQTTYATAGNTWELVEWILNGTEESLCITSDAKVGVGIANPQRSLEVAGDLVVGGTISGGAGMGSFRNRIINGDMRIAQRGTSNVAVGAAAYYYMIDRFALTSGGGSFTQTQQTLGASDTPYQIGLRYSLRITCTIPQNPISYLEPLQSIEGYNISDLNWGTSFGVPVTVSFWFRTNLAPGSVFCFSVRDGAGSLVYPIPFTALGNGSWQYVTGTVPPPPNGTTIGATNGIGVNLYIAPLTQLTSTHTPYVWSGSGYAAATNVVNWAQNAGNYIEFTGVQLEKGTVATPFEFRPFATELALCQRYYQTLNTSGGSGVSGGILAIGHAGSSSVVQVAIPLKVSMRVGPTSFSNTAVGNYIMTQGGTGYPITAFSMPYVSSELVWFQTANSGTIPNVGGAAIFYAANSSGFLAFSAEL
jgi:hypothetical protein